MRKWQKRIFTIFKTPYDPKDINARRDFFSRIAWLIVRKLCANFEENRRGPPIGQFFSIAYNFFSMGTFLKIIASLCLGFYGVSYDTPFAQVIYYKKMTKWQKTYFYHFQTPL